VTERGLAVARSLQLQLAELALQGFWAFPVARVASVVARRVVLLVAQMIGHLGLQGPLQYGFGQVLEQSVLPDDILRVSCSWSAGWSINFMSMVMGLLFSTSQTVYTVLFTPSQKHTYRGVYLCLIERPPSLSYCRVMSDEKATAQEVSDAAWSPGSCPRPARVYASPDRDREP
jgi:hypothetical protein